MSSNKLIVIPIILVVISLFSVAVPIIDVEDIEYYKVSTPYNVTMPHEEEVSYFVQVPYLVNETLTVVLKNHTLVEALDPTKIYYFHFDLNNNDRVLFFVKVEGNKKFTSYIIGSANFEIFKVGFSKPFEVARTFYGSGLLEYTCTFDDTYYFVWENQENNDISLKGVEIVKLLEVEMTKYKNELQYKNETQYKTEIRYRDLTHNRTITKKVTLLSYLLGSW